jgi:hypothetical protein
MSNPVATPPPSADRSLQKPAGSQSGARPPAHLPSRASVQLPSLPEREAEPAARAPRVPGRAATPAQARLAPPPAEPDDASLGWAEEFSSSPPRAFGPLGLVAAALLVMVGVYLGAMMLLK